MAMKPPVSSAGGVVFAAQRWRLAEGTSCQWQHAFVRGEPVQTGGRREKEFSERTDFF
jgi:hypothetical protein